MKLEWNKAMLSRSPEETWELASALLAEVRGPALLALHGELGTGKTCFVQGLAHSLGIAQPVTSPTFTIINEYRADPPLYHIDLYRLSGPDEIIALGFDEYLEGAGIVAIEWAERAGELLPPETIHIEFTSLPLPDERLILIRPGIS